MPSWSKRPASGVAANSNLLCKPTLLNEPSAIDGYPPLHVAVLLNDAELVEFVLENGADLTQTDQRHGLSASVVVRRGTWAGGLRLGRSFQSG